MPVSEGASSKVPVCLLRSHSWQVMPLGREGHQAGVPTHRAGDRGRVHRRGRCGPLLSDQERCREKHID